MTTVSRDVTSPTLPRCAPSAYPSPVPSLGVSRLAVPRPSEARDAPIGIFDSGFGGLTVARSVIDQLPHESIVYLGDTARQPYGPKPIGEVREYALECLDHLVERGREDAGHRLQLRQRRDAARRPGAVRRARSSR